MLKNLREFLSENSAVSLYTAVSIYAKFTCETGETWEDPLVRTLSHGPAGGFICGVVQL